MSALKIDQVPSAFAAIGEKHNALVDVVKGMSGAGGISVKVSEANVIIDGSGISVTGGGGTEGDPIQVVGSTGLLNTVPKHSTWATPTTYPTNLAIVNGAVTASMNVAGFGYEDAVITAVLGANGLRIEDNGTNAITVDELGIDWSDGTSAWGISSTGLRYSDALLLNKFGEDGVYISDGGTKLARLDELGYDYSSGAITVALDDVGAKVDYGTNFFRITADGFELSNGSGVISIPFSALTGTIRLREIDVCVSGEAKKMQILASEYY